MFKNFNLVVLDKDDFISLKEKVEYFKKNVKGHDFDINSGKKLYRKSICSCGSGKKFKRCCWNKYYN